MSRFAKVLSPGAAVALVAALLLLSRDGDGPSRPRPLPSRALPAAVHVTQLGPLPASNPVVAPQAPVAEPSCSHEDEGHGVGETGGHCCSAPTVEETREFVEQVHAEMAKLGIDASANSEFPSTPECGPVRQPTQAELEQMQREFAETEQVLRELETQSPRDPQPTARR